MIHYFLTEPDKKILDFSLKFLFCFYKILNVNIKDF